MSPPLGAAADPLHVIQNFPNSASLPEEPKSHTTDSKRKRSDGNLVGIRAAPGRQCRAEMIGATAASGVCHSKGAEDHDVRKNSGSDTIGQGDSDRIYQASRGDGSEANVHAVDTPSLQWNDVRPIRSVTKPPVAT